MTVPPPFFVHIHVPKTGGTTFNELLARNFGDTFELHQSRWVQQLPRITARQVVAFMQRHPGVVAAASHAFTISLPYRYAQRSVTGIAWIRDPVDHFFSKYFHLRRRTNRTGIERSLGLEEYVAVHERRCRESGHPHTGQVYFLSQSHGGPRLMREVYDMIAERRLLLLPTARMSEGLALLQARYPEHFRDLAHGCSNISPRDQELSPELRARGAALLGQYDHELLILANRCLDEGLAAVSA